VKKLCHGLRLSLSRNKDATIKGDLMIAAGTCLTYVHPQKSFAGLPGKTVEYINQYTGIKMLTIPTSAPDGNMPTAQSGGYIILTNYSNLLIITFTVVRWWTPDLFSLSRGSCVLLIGFALFYRVISGRCLQIGQRPTAIGHPSSNYDNDITVAFSHDSPLYSLRRAVLSPVWK